MKFSWDDAFSKGVFSSKSASKSMPSLLRTVYTHAYSLYNTLVLYYLLITIAPCKDNR